MMGLRFMNWLILCFVFVSVFLICQTEAALKSYKNYRLLKIEGDAEIILNLNDMDFQNPEEPPSMLSFSHDKNQGLFLVHEDDFDDILNYTRENDLELSIKPNRIDRQINFVNEINNKRRLSSKMQNRFGNGNNGREYYMRYQEIKDWLNLTAKKYNFTTFEIIGKTSENRDIGLFKISKNPNKPIIWIDGGIHAREWISPATAIGLIKKLLDNSDLSNNYLDNHQFFFIPLINPDGYEYTHNTDRMWRKNRVRTSYQCFGVDLNRNFPYKWGGPGSSPSPCKEIYRGKSANSELETQTITHIMTQYKNKIELYINLHSYGQYILMPYAYKANRYTRNYFSSLNVAQKAALKIQSSFSRVYKVGSSSTLLYAAAGTADDFAAGSLNIKYAYTVELPDTGRYGFAIPPDYIPSAVGQVGLIIESFYRNKDTYN